MVNVIRGNKKEMPALRTLAAVIDWLNEECFREPFQRSQNSIH